LHTTFCTSNAGIQWRVLWWEFALQQTPYYLTSIDSIPYREFRGRELLHLWYLSCCLSLSQKDKQHDRPILIVVYTVNGLKPIPFTVTDVMLP